LSASSIDISLHSPAFPHKITTGKIRETHIVKLPVRFFFFGLVLILAGAHRVSAQTDDDKEKQ
jgi:hypothetical protein